MLRINLLPPYIYEGAKRRNVIIVWVIVFLAVIVGAMYYKSTIDAETKAMDEKAASLESKANTADANQQKADQVKQEGAVIVAKANFVKNARKHNEEVYPQLYHNIVAYTWNPVLYDLVSTEAGKDSIGMNAFAPTLNDLGQYIMAMERNPNIKQVDIKTNSIPGFPPVAAGGQQGNQGGAGVRPPGGAGHDFQVALVLVNPVPAGPNYGGGSGGGNGGGPGGPGGPSMGFSGGGSPGMTSGGGSMGMGKGQMGL